MLREKLDYVMAIAQEQNLTKAAKKLYISQPTLSLYLSRLEEDLGVQLFDRSKVPITITPAGKYYIEQMTTITAFEQSMRSEIQFIASPTQTLIVGIGPVRGRHWMPGVLECFCKKHPKINIQLVQLPGNSLRDALQLRKIDLAIGAHQSDMEGITAEHLLSEDCVLVAHKKFGIVPKKLRRGNGAQHPYLTTPEALNDLPLIVPSVTNGMHSSYNELIRKNKFRPSRTITVNDLSTGLLLAGRGLGVLLISTLMQEYDPERGSENLDYFLLPEMPPDRACFVYYNESSLKLALIRDFVKAIHTEVLPKLALDE